MKLPVTEELGVGGEIINHLRHQTPDVDGVGGGEHAGRGCIGRLIVFGKGFLHTALAVIKIAANGTDTHVGALLGDHLGLLHGRNAAVGEEDGDVSAGDVMKALQSGLSRVAGGGSEDGDLPVDALYLLCSGDKEGEHGQGNVFKGAGGAVIKLKGVGVSHRAKGRDFRRGKLFRIDRGDFLCHAGKAGKKVGEYFSRHLRIGQRKATGNIKGAGGDIGIYKQSAVRCNALKDGSSV